MARTQSTETTELTSAQLFLRSKIEAANGRRESLKARGMQNVLPTNYYAPTPVQVENLVIALVADADWRNETEQEESSANVVFVFRKRNLGAGEQPTILRYGYNPVVNAVVLTVTGSAMPAGFSLDGIAPHEVIAAEKANAKRKATAKADKARSEAFTALGF